jgi:hypothetical protein
MITKQKLLQKIRAEIQHYEYVGWKYGDLINIAKRYGYTVDNIHRIRRNMRGNKVHYFKIPDNDKTTA